MKLNNIFPLIVLCISLSSCVPEKAPENAKASFSFDLSGSESSRLNSSSAPNFLIVSIRNTENNQLVYNMLKLELFSLDGGFISEEIELFVGEYEVVDFLIANAENEVIYLTPKKGSEFADIVNTPLPHSFQVSASETTQVNLEVIPADLGDAVEYGYSVFGFDIVQTLEKGLIAKYLFNENTLDSAEHEIHLSATEGSPNIQYITDRHGKENAAIYFDGSFGLMAFGDSYETGLFNQSSPQSMSFWFKTSHKNDENIYGGAMVRIETYGGSRFYTSLADSKIQINYGETSVPPYGDLFTVDSYESDNTWKHVVFVSFGDGEYGELYINGMKVDQDFTYTTSNNNSSNPSISIGGTYINNYFIGGIDDVKLYNRVLTEKEILELFLEGGLPYLGTPVSSSLSLRPDGTTSKDAVISHYYSTKNYGNEEDIHLYGGTISGVPNHNRVLIDFDLSEIPVNATIDSAYLNLYFNYSSGYSTEHNGPAGYTGSTDFDIYRITSSWDESTVTYESQPAFDQGISIQVPGAETGTQNFENIDVTDLVEKIIQQPETSHGFLLKLTQETPYRMLLLASSDHPDESIRPKLEVFYTH